MCEPKKSIWSNPPHGFRIMWWDPLVLLATLLSVAIGWRFVGPASLLLLFVAANFFLFCNVFRVRRRYELYWAGTFVALTALCTSLSINLLYLALSQSAVSLLVIALEMRSARYHGILHRQVHTLFHNRTTPRG